VARTRELELSLGDAVKRVEANERDAKVIQRRCVRLARDLPAGVSLTSADLKCLRPQEPGSFNPQRLTDIVGSSLVRDMACGEAVRSEDLVPRC
jgi:N-acetylneuraminate synthase